MFSVPAFTTEPVTVTAEVVASESEASKVVAVPVARVRLPVTERTPGSKVAPTITVLAGALTRPLPPRPPERVRSAAERVVRSNVEPVAKVTLVAPKEAAPSAMSVPAETRVGPL